VAILGLAGCAAGEESDGERVTATSGPAVDTSGGTVASIRAALETPGVQVLGYRVVTEREHDTDAFTQGLALRDGVLFEGTGLYGESRIVRSTFPDGGVTAERDLSDDEFGEGVEVLGDRVYQLTWKEGTAHVYSAESLRQVGTLDYDGEGWGLATDGERLIMSDGTSQLRFRDPATFEVQRSVTVRDDGGPLDRLNELEYVGGAVLANVWQSDRIAIIDPANGELEGWLDLTGLNPDPDNLSDNDVLNGIAFDRRTGRLLVTGKRWPTLFEIVPA
jgi:glutamine cyclotransferase